MKEDIKVSEDQATAIENQTRNQSKSNKWMDEREFRLTASHFGEICKAQNRDIEKFCKSMHTPKDLSRVPAIRHGQTYESVALKKFSELTGKKVLPSGFCIHPQFPYLGATPDGFVQDESAVIETKCPFRGRNSKIEPGDDFSFLEKDDQGKTTLKKNSNYYYQITGQMKLSKRNHGYFVVFTHVDLFYEKITLDEEFFTKNMLDKLKDFYYEHYCPYVASVLKR